MRTRGEREFRVCWPSFWAFVAGSFVPGFSFLYPRFGRLLLGVLLLDPRSWILVFGCFLDILFLDPRSWRFVLVHGGVGRIAADSGLHWLQVASCGIMCFKSVSGRCGGLVSVRIIEDILLSEHDSGGRSKKKGRASCGKRSEREQGREMVYKKVQVLTNISKIGLFNNME
jgi:hypothetical protein